MLSRGPNSWFWVLQINQEWPVAVGHLGSRDCVGVRELGGATDIELAFILSLDAAIMTSE